MTIKEQMRRLVTDIKNEASAVKNECSEHDVVDNPHLIGVFNRVERILEKADKLNGLLKM